MQVFFTFLIFPDKTVISLLFFFLVCLLLIFSALSSVEAVRSYWLYVACITLMENFRAP